MGRYGTSQSRIGARRQALLDGVLMRARKSGEHEVPDVGMARMNGQLIAAFGAARRLVDVGEI
jgi:hypothetical protein